MKKMRMSFLTVFPAALLFFVLIFSAVKACVPPSIDGPSEICVNESFLFTTDADSVISYKWYAAQGGFISSNSIDSVWIMWKKPGTFKVKLVITKAGSCTDSSETEVIVHDIPKVDIGSEDTLVCRNSTFSKTYESHEGVSFVWLLGNDIVSTRRNYTKTFDVPGKYTITLVVANSTGCSGQDSFSFEVLKEADAQFTTNLLDSFTVELSAADTTHQTFLYYLDENISPICSTKNCIYTFSAAGNYTISLKVTDSTGCLSSDSAQITIGKSVNIQNFEAFPMSFSVFPNPSANIFTIEFEAKITENLQLAVKDISGRTLCVSGQKTVSQGKNTFTFSPEMHGLKAGIYFLSMKSDTKISVPQKIIYIP